MPTSPLWPTANVDQKRIKAVRVTECKNPSCTVRTE